jgi:hypothetical protein
MAMSFGTAKPIMHITTTTILTTMSGRRDD